ncbi:TPA: hypothetical protein QCJ52_004551 [Enterobacter ludwigii]|nr:hypothetical protein [Enterobacter ludwigii]
MLVREEKALQAMPDNLANLPRSQLYLKPFNLVGLEALRELFTQSKAAPALPDTTLNVLDLPKLSSLVDELSQTGNGLVMTMGTAPTGHTLLLLDATGAYHREMVRQMGQTHDNLLTPMMLLQDPEKTKVIIVTLAETTPVLEAANLQQDLRRAEIEPWAWVINSSLAAAKPSSPFLVTRASRELPLINDVTEQFAERIALTPLQNEEPVGAALLAKMAG